MNAAAIQVQILVLSLSRTNMYNWPVTHLSANYNPDTAIVAAAVILHFHSPAAAASTFRSSPTSSRNVDAGLTSTFCRTIFSTRGALRWCRWRIRSGRL